MCLRNVSCPGIQVTQIIQSGIYARTVCDNTQIDRVAESGLPDQFRAGTALVNVAAGEDLTQELTGDFLDYLNLNPSKNELELYTGLYLNNNIFFQLR